MESSAGASPNRSAKPLDQDGEGQAGIALDGSGALESAHPGLERRSLVFVAVRCHRAGTLKRLKPIL